MLPKFTARERAMTQLEANVIAFGRATAALPAGAAKTAAIAAWTRAKNEVGALRTELEQAKVKVSEAIQAYAWIRSKLSAIPGLNLSGLGVAIPAIVGTAQFLATLGVIALGLSLGLKFVAHFDAAAANDQERWRDIQKLPPADRAKAIAAFQAAGGDSDKLSQFVSKLSGALMWILAAAILLPLVLKRGSR
jgi:hypothetical protein